MAAQLRVWLASALAFGGDTHSVDDVWAQVQEGEAQLWWCETGCAVTQVVQYPQRRHLRIWLAAGDMGAMRTLQPDILQFGRTAECAAAEFHGRPGWERTFLTRDDGWESGLVTFTKEL